MRNDPIEPVLGFDSFAVKDSTEQAPPGLTFSVYQGDLIGITASKIYDRYKLVRALGNRLPHEHDVSGQLRCFGRNVSGLSNAAFKSITKNALSIVSLSSETQFSCHQSLGDQLLQRIRVAQTISYSDAQNVCKAMLARLGLRDVERYMQRFPHEVSGPDDILFRIASATLSRPKLLIVEGVFEAVGEHHSKRIISHLKDLQSLGTGVLVIASSTEFLGPDCDMVYALETGKQLDMSQQYPGLSLPSAVSA